MIFALAFVIAQPYFLQDVELEDLNHRFTLVRRRDNLKLWTKTISDPFGPQWTSDGKAVAFFDAGRGVLVVWREGLGIRSYDLGEPDTDDCLQISWAPGKKRLFFLGGGNQGRLAIGVGSIFAVNLDTGAKMVFEHDVAQARGLDGRRLRLTYIPSWATEPYRKLTVTKRCP